MDSEIINISESEEVYVVADINIPGYIKRNERNIPVQIAGKNIPASLDLSDYATREWVEENYGKIDDKDPNFVQWRTGESLLAGKNAVNTPINGTVYGSESGVVANGGVAIGHKSWVRASDVIDSDEGIAPFSVGDVENGVFRRLIGGRPGVSPTDFVIKAQLEAGLRGESAYEIAVRNGFDGTEQEWLESLKAPATSANYRVIGDLSETDRVFEFDLGRVKCRIIRKDTSTFGVIMYADPDLEMLVQRIDNSDFSSNSAPAKKYTIVPYGTVLDDIPTTADRVSAIVTTENYSFRIDAIATSDFKQCVVVVNQYSNYEGGAEIEPKYKIRRWVNDLSSVGKAINVDVDGLRWTLKYKSASELSWVVAPISDPVNVAFYRASIWTGGAENTPFAWRLLDAQTNVDETVHNNSQDWSCVRFITEKGSYKLEACAFDSGRHCEVLLHYISDIPNEG